MHHVTAQVLPRGPCTQNVYPIQVLEGQNIHYLVHGPEEVQEKTLLVPLNRILRFGRDFLVCSAAVVSFPFVGGVFPAPRIIYRYLGRLVMISVDKPSNKHDFSRSR